MGKRVELTPRDRECMAALATKVRTMSLAQIARTWWPMAADPLRAARFRIADLAMRGYLIVERAPVHPELDFQFS